MGDATYKDEWMNRIRALPPSGRNGDVSIAKGGASPWHSPVWVAAFRPTFAYFLANNEAALNPRSFAA
jgi:hypothetical protein